MNRIMIVFGAVAVFALQAHTATISVAPSEDLVAKVATAQSGDTIQLSAGTFEIAQQIALSGKSDITFVGAGKDKTFIVVKDGVSSRHISLSGMTNVKFDGISFRNAKLEYSSTDATSVRGGSFDVANCVNLQLENCSFISNQVQNTATASPDVNLKGGAFYVVDSDIHFSGCDFEQNGILWTAENKKGSYSTGKECHGGTIYMSTPTGASTSTLRINLTATNCVFRSNFMTVRCNGTESLNYAALMYLASVGADFYNCLMTGTYMTKECASSEQYRLPRSVIQTAGDGTFHRYTHCTLADNVATAGISGKTDSKTSAPILIRSIIGGHWADFEVYLGSSNPLPKPVLIDSIYSSGTDPVASVKLFGTTYTSSNYFKTNVEDVVMREGQAATGTIAATLNAGWRPTDGHAYHDWYVAADVGASDSNAGTKAAPFRTLTKALSVCGNGDAIYLAAGSYTQSAGEVFPLDFSDKLGIKIKGSGRDVTLIDGEGDTTKKTPFVFYNTHGFRLYDLSICRMDPKPDTSITAAYPVNGIPVIFSMKGCGHPVFRNVGICNNRLIAAANKTFSGMMVMVMSVEVSFQDCLLTNNYHKSHAYNSGETGWMWHARWSSLVLDRCEVRENGWIPYSAAKPGNHTANLVYMLNPNCKKAGAFTARNCLFSKNGEQGGTQSGTTAEGYFSIQTSDPVHFENCTFVGHVNGTLFRFSRTLDDTGYSGSGFKSGLYNCIVSHSGTAVTFYNGVANAYNTLFSCAATEDTSIANFKNYATFADDGTVLGVDPKFKDAANGDYHLTAASTEAIDKAATLGWMTADTKDLDGNPRVAGYLSKKNLLADIGCYELPRKRTGLVLIFR